MLSFLTFSIGCLLISDEDVDERLGENAGEILEPVDDTGSTWSDSDSATDSAADSDTDSDADSDTAVEEDSGTAVTDTAEEEETTWPGLTSADWADTYNIRGGEAFAYTFNYYGQATGIMASCDDVRITVTINDPDTTTKGWGTGTMVSTSDGIPNGDDGLDGASGVYATCWMESDQNAPSFFVHIYPY